MRQRIFHIMLLLSIVSIPTFAQKNNGSGLELGAEGEYKISKKASVSLGTAFRTRNSFKTVDRWSFSVGGSYKILSPLKISGGYTLLYNNNIEKINYDDYGEVKNWRPSYWGIRHRFNVSLTGILKVKRFTFSLRERWQYTYRPEKTTRRYDFRDEAWEDKTISGKGKNILRSRLQIDYNIRKCKITPYVNAELFNSCVVEKIRVIGGANWNVTKHHQLSLYYRYQKDFEPDEDFDPNMHTLGVCYKFKF